MVSESDPRPVLRKELTRVFKNQRVIRAFEKIFDLIPSESIDNQAQIDALSLITELGITQSNESIAAVVSLASSIDRLLMAPSEVFKPASDGLLPVPVSDSFLIGDGLVGLSPNSRPAIDQSIVPTWTGVHIFSAATTFNSNVVVNTPAAGKTLVLNCIDGEAALQALSATVDMRIYAYPTGAVGIVGTASAHDVEIWVNTVASMRLSSARVTFNLPARLKGYTVATLPAGTVGDTAYVTNALAPAYGAAVAGGGAVTVPVFYNGAAWITA